MTNRPALLVVDDEVDLLATYRRLLARDGFRVVTAATCVEALRALTAERFRVIVTDMRLPDGSGLDVIRAARDNGHGAPAIVVTGFPSHEARRAASDAGAADFFAKPFDAAALAARVRALADT